MAIYVWDRLGNNVQFDTSYYDEYRSRCRATMDLVDWHRWPETLRGGDYPSLENADGGLLC